jgi:D-alanyl-lipoteichoic acid acyltransferase DltB (MBOAT superfamily)
MIAAGPIQSYEDFLAGRQMSPALSVPAALGAVDRIVAGLFKKFVIAQSLERLFLTGFQSQGAYLFLEIQVYYVWLYLDFSAYSDIAVGLGQLLGISTPENFNKPLLARNPIEFWERWHISLSQWIRRNIFVPLQMAMLRRTGGQRVLLLTSVAFTISFLLCGLWHGVGWRWLGWGAIHAVALVACNLYRHVLTEKLGKKGLKQYLADRRIRVVATAMTFEYIAFSLFIANVRF